MNTAAYKLAFRPPPKADVRTGDKYNDGFHVFRAVEKALEALGYSIGASKPTVGVLWFCQTNKGEGFITDALELCKAEGGVDGLLIVTADDIREDEVPVRESPILCVHKERIQICKADFGAISQAMIKLYASVEGSDESFRQKLAQVVATYAVFQPINVAAGHGARNDVTNRLFAPMRLLAKQKDLDIVKIKETWARCNDKTKGRSCWENFTDAFKEEATNVRMFSAKSVIAMQLVTEFNSVKNNFVSSVKSADKTSHESVDKLASALEALMSLMTECRRNAGIVTNVESPKTTKEESKPLHSVVADKPYRLLVVDDHWADWKPVVENIVACIPTEAGAKITIAYSENGEKAWEPGAEGKGDPSDSIIAAAFQADAVLLDIMIGDNKNGLHVLREIREYSKSIPVILWTTTRSQEITNQAQQANGVILKKTCESEAFAETLAYWIQVGRNRRGTTLLNPFFDSVITTPVYRVYASEITEWALKWMSGFHATGDYFRVFTDHGGRHFTRVLRFLEEAVHPFLGDETVFSDDPNVREEEFLALYLAVFLHEIGMFPLTKMDMRALDDPKYMNSVRELHAPRGMLMLADNVKYWRDERGNTIRQMLYERLPTNIRLQIATLVGYHARFFQSLDSGMFLKWDALKDSAGKSLGKADRFGMFDGKAEDIFQNCLSYLNGAFPDGVVKLRLAKQAALLRVSDAVDKDRTRIPPAYLCGAGLFDMDKIDDAAPAHNNELLKSLVCTYVEVKNGVISMTVDAKAPAASKVNMVTGGAFSGTDEDIENLWGKVTSVKGWGRQLENYLSNKWKDVISNSGNATDANLSELVSLSALACGAEVIDEYEAVVATGLKGKVLLDDSKLLWTASKHQDRVDELKRLLGDTK